MLPDIIKRKALTAVSKMPSSPSKIDDLEKKVLQELRTLGGTLEMEGNRRKSGARGLSSYLSPFGDSSKKQANTPCSLYSDDEPQQRLFKRDTKLDDRAYLPPPQVGSTFMRQSIDSLAVTPESRAGQQETEFLLTEPKQGRIGSPADRLPEEFDIATPLDRGNVSRDRDQRTFRSSDNRELNQTESSIDDASRDYGLAESILLGQNQPASTATKEDDGLETHRTLGEVLPAPPASSPAGLDEDMVACTGNFKNSPTIEQVRQALQTETKLENLGTGFSRLGMDCKLVTPLDPHGNGTTGSLPQKLRSSGEGIGPSLAELREIQPATSSSVHPEDDASFDQSYMVNGAVVHIVSRSSYYNQSEQSQPHPSRHGSSITSTPRTEDEDGDAVRTNNDNAHPVHSRNLSRFRTSIVGPQRLEILHSAREGLEHLASLEDILLEDQLSQDAEVGDVWTEGNESLNDVEPVEHGVDGIDLNVTYKGKVPKQIEELMASVKPADREAVFGTPLRFGEISAAPSSRDGMESRHKGKKMVLPLRERESESVTEPESNKHQHTLETVDIVRTANQERATSGGGAPDHLADGIINGPLMTDRMAHMPEGARAQMIRTVGTLQNRMVTTDAHMIAAMELMAKDPQNSAPNVSDVVVDMQQKRHKAREQWTNHRKSLSEVEALGFMFRNNESHGSGTNATPHISLQGLGRTMDAMSGISGKSRALSGTGALASDIMSAGDFQARRGKKELLQKCRQLLHERNLDAKSAAELTKRIEQLSDCQGGSDSLSGFNGTEGELASVSEMKDENDDLICQLVEGDLKHIEERTEIEHRMNKIAAEYDAKEREDARFDELKKKAEQEMADMRKKFTEALRGVTDENSSLQEELYNQMKDIALFDAWTVKSSVNHSNPALSGIHSIPIGHSGAVSYDSPSKVVSSSSSVVSGSLKNHSQLVPQSYEMPRMMGYTEPTRSNVANGSNSLGYQGTIETPANQDLQGSGTDSVSSAYRTAPVHAQQASCHQPGCSPAFSNGFSSNLHRSGYSGVSATGLKRRTSQVSAGCLSINALSVLSRAEKEDRLAQIAQQMEEQQQQHLQQKQCEYDSQLSEHQRLLEMLSKSSRSGGCSSQEENSAEMLAVGPPNNLVRRMLQRRTKSSGAGQSVISSGPSYSSSFAPLTRATGPKRKSSKRSIGGAIRGPPAQLIRSREPRGDQGRHLQQVTTRLRQQEQQNANLGKEMRRRIIS